VVVDWATLYVQRVPDGAIESVAIGAEIPLSTDIDVLSEWNAYDAVRWRDPATLGLEMPWGEVLGVPLPLTGGLSLVGTLPST
jgi:hypothetical protein